MRLRWVHLNDSNGCLTPSPRFPASSADSALAAVTEAVSYGGVSDLSNEPRPQGVTHEGKALPAAGRRFLDIDREKSGLRSP